MALVVVRGVGDVGSAVALALFRDGQNVVLHDRPKAAHARRGAAFTDALYEGKTHLDGVYGKYAESIESLRYILRCRRALAISAQEFGSLLAAIRPDVVVDARMRKHTRPEVQRGLAPLTIGVGPNFVAGETADLVVETAYGPNLGTVIRSGCAQDLTGQPRELGGHRGERFVYAPIGGTFRTRHNIGAHVTVGEEVATIEGAALRAPLSGRLRGLAHDGAIVDPGAKVIEVDASDAPDPVTSVGERPRRIAEGVVAAIHASPGVAPA